MVESYEKKKESERNEEKEITVDDLVPAIQELAQRIERLENSFQVLREHEHGTDGKPVVRM